MSVDRANLTAQLPKGETVMRAMQAQSRGGPLRTAQFWLDELRAALAEDVDRLLSLKFDPAAASQLDKERLNVIDRLNAEIKRLKTIDLANHHNAAACPYCIPSDELRVALRDIDASSLLKAIAMWRENTKPLCLAQYPLEGGGTLKCTLEPGHAGDHDASGCQTWSDEPTVIICGIQSLAGCHERQGYWCHHFVLNSDCCDCGIVERHGVQPNGAVDALGASTT